MKKYLKILFTVVVCLSLCGCALNNTTPPEASPSPDNIIPPEASPSPDNIIQPECPSSPTDNTGIDIAFDSYDEFRSRTSKENEEKLFESLSGNGTNQGKIDAIKPFITRLQTDGIPVPFMNSKCIELRSKEGYSDISLYYPEYFGLTWIFYHPKVSTGENFYIKITFLPNSVKGKNLSASQVIKEISPNSANLNNLGNQHKAIFEQTVKLSDREVTALVFEYNNDNRNSMMFCYDDLLVEVRADTEVWSEQWFSALSFGSYK